ncbi:MAG: DoxX family protein [Gammaproteobacteria bacterium]|nr:DoxX family protein [Gammaproteobacteria bacterium]MBK9428047.1 DoxX family protein [Gammaproteobacteria bacterium]
MHNYCSCVHNATQKIGPLLGRLLIAAVFIPAGLLKIPGFETTAGYMAAKGLPFVALLLVLTILIEFGGGLMILLGWRARDAALVLFLFLIPVTVVFHGFWGIEDPVARAAEQRAFMKNIGIMGGVLFVAAFGSGPLSLDGSGKRPTT